MFIILKILSRYTLICRNGITIFRKRAFLRISVTIVWVSSLLVVIPLIVFTDTVGNEGEQQCALGKSLLIHHVDRT